MRSNRVVQLEEIAEIVLTDERALEAVDWEPSGSIVGHPEAKSVELAGLLVVLKEDPPNQKGDEKGEYSGTPEKHERAVPPVLGQFIQRHRGRVHLKVVGSNFGWLRASLGPGIELSGRRLYVKLSGRSFNW